MSRTPRVALVHDRFDQNGGAERVMWALHRLFPDAPIFTAMWNRKLVSRFVGAEVRTSWMQLLPGIERNPRAYAALYPLAFAGMDLRGFDLVISSTSSFAHGITTQPGALHVCYCHTPSNFVWRPDLYFTSRGRRAAAAPLRAWLKRWEASGARRPDVYIANSETVAGRIRRFYSRPAAVIPPPIEDCWFVDHVADEFLLVVSRLVEQKRVDIAVRAARHARLPLLIAGDGRAEARLHEMAGPNVRFLGRVTDSELRGLYSRAAAVLLPGEEDFGLVPVEAQAAGTPVIAYDAGGARETVVHGVTGIRFAPQTADALAAAIRETLARPWDRQLVQVNAEKFRETRFQAALQSLLARHLEPAGPDVKTAPVGAGHAL